MSHHRGKFFAGPGTLPRDGSARTRVGGRTDKLQVGGGADKLQVGGGPTNLQDAAAGGVAGRSLGAEGPGAVAESDGSDSDEGEETTAVALPAPPRPTPQMVADHQVAHVPFRSWCPACVRGRARGSCHFGRNGADDAQLPVIGVDY